MNITAAIGGNQVTATNNWWGTNVPASTIVTAGSTCPAAANTNDVCFDPFIVLTHQASPEKIRINQSTTLTGDMSKDNHGNGAALVRNLTQIIGLPITFASGPLGSIPQAQPETLNASAQATATFNAGGTSGRANPTATVDQGTALALDSLISSATEAGYDCDHYHGGRTWFCYRRNGRDFRRRRRRIQRHIHHYSHAHRKYIYLHCDPRQGSALPAAERPMSAS